MRRPLLSLCILAVTGAAVFIAAARASNLFCCQHVCQGADELKWLQQEFKLDSVQLERIRTLHEGYKPACRSF